eukprot:c20778_g1_i1.p1 GENE.c20778_g1_i1~~c20778_g1_i1.p1  ORF type:complete len:316 (+),score=59.52 c20778_g1_i1:72-1019(+)
MACDNTLLFHEIAKKKSNQKGILFEATLRPKIKTTCCNFLCTAAEIGDSIIHISRLVDSTIHQEKMGNLCENPEEFDNECQTLLSVCSDRIEVLKHLSAVESQVTCPVSSFSYLDDDLAPLTTTTQPLILNHPQAKAHFLGVIMILLDKLSTTSDKFSKLRSFHLSRAHSSRNKIMLHHTSKHSSPISTTTTPPPAVCDDSSEVFADEFGSAETMKQENNNLVFELDVTLDKIRHAEMRLQQISSLATLFSTKIEEQAATIEHLYDETLAVSSNISTANQILARTNSDSSSFRIWILFFLITASSALLFLDWYGS